jgi:hypothetical protein
MRVASGLMVVLHLMGSVPSDGGVQWNVP